ncbi:MAG: trans-aconitate 2-methyltransferase [Kiritimatiellales bacterium]
MAKNIAAAIRNCIPLSGSMTAMDFGCGTGLISRELFPNLGKITAVDTSPGMIEQLQKRIQESGIANIQAHCLDLLTDPPGETFDLIFSSMALHHVQDTAALLDRFTELLNPGGRLALADLDREDGSFHGNFNGFLHYGFSRETLTNYLDRLGYTGISIETAHTVHKNARDYPVFLLTARRS